MRSAADAPVVVTGATGLVGGMVLRELRLVGVRAVAAVRDPAPFRAAGGARGGAVEARAFDFLRPATWSGALAGARSLFLVRPPAISDVEETVLPAVDAARDAGVEHVVFLSLLGAEKNRVVPHRAIEDHLRASGLEWTFLRASFFMQNLSTTHAMDIRERGEILVPAGRGRTSFVDARDVGEVAARALLGDEYRGRALDLTGDRALGYGEVAEILSEALGRDIRYPHPGLLRFARHMRGRGHPWGFVLVMAGIYTTARLGLAGRVTDDVERVLGRPAIPFRAFAEDHRWAWTA